MANTELFHTMLVGFRWPLFGLGALLFVVGLTATVYEASRAPDRPILRSPTAIAVSGRGELFVYSDWGQIGVFSSDGHPLRSWRVATGQGLAALAFEKPGILSVAAVRTGQLYQFSSGGKLLNVEHDPLAYERLRPQFPPEAMGPSGESYWIEGQSILLRDVDGGVRIVIQEMPHVLGIVLLAARFSIVVTALGATLFIVGAALVSRHAAEASPR